MEDDKVDVLDISPEAWNQRSSKFTMEKRVGNGGQGAAYLKHWKEPAGKQVLKVFSQKRYAEEEAKILEIVSPHKRIVEFLQLCHQIPTPAHSCLTVHFCESGDLWHLKTRWISEQKPVPEVFLWKIFFQLAEAMAYLH